MCARTGRPSGYINKDAAARGCDIAVRNAQSSSPRRSGARAAAPMEHTGNSQAFPAGRHPPSAYWLRVGQLCGRRPRRPRRSARPWRRTVVLGVAGRVALWLLRSTWAPSTAISTTSGRWTGAGWCRSSAARRGVRGVVGVEPSDAADRSVVRRRRRSAERERGQQRRSGRAARGRRGAAAGLVRSRFRFDPGGDITRRAVPARRRRAVGPAGHRASFVLVTGPSGGLGGHPVGGRRSPRRRTRVTASFSPETTSPRAGGGRCAVGSNRVCPKTPGPICRLVCCGARRDQGRVRGATGVGGGGHARQDRPRLAALYLSLLAVGAHPSPLVVLVAFGAANVAGMIPLTPGGLGFVEAGITATLVASGIDPAHGGARHGVVSAGQHVATGRAGVARLRAVPPPPPGRRSGAAVVVDTSAATDDQRRVLRRSPPMTAASEGEQGRGAAPSAGLHGRGGSS